MQEEIFFPLGGGIAGASIYSNLGGIGIIGSFGGLSVGLTGMTAAGAVMGFAFYGAVKGIEDGDVGVFIASGLGAVGGIGASTIIGGAGVSFAGGAFGIGTFSMAAMGGIFGLGVYGLAKMFSSSQSTEYFAETFNRMEDKISFDEAYNQAMLELNPLFMEQLWREKFNQIEIEEELKTLKSQNNVQKQLKLSWNFFNNSYEFIDNGIEEEFINTEPESFEIELEENYVWKSIKTLKGHTGTINSLAIHRNIIASSSQDSTVCLWDMEAEKHIFSFFEPSEVNDVAINKQIIVAANQNKNITSWKLENKALNKTFSRNTHNSVYKYLHNDCHDGLISSIVLSHDGKTLFSSSGNKTIRAWNASTGKLEFTLTGHTDLAG